LSDIVASQKCLECIYVSDGLIEMGGLI
jgi:hypothetical protein